ncbi:MAG: NAD(P)H-hydrate dehydratase [Myxococcales bacterium]|nr:NAD(P)H-hydrate dehydratase [Myxococcales bacterium]
MKLLSSSQMRSLDESAITQHRIPSMELMENAGRALADVAATSRPSRAAVVCGRGNNGGDGLVAARYLIGMGIDVAVLILASPQELSPDARANWERLVRISTRVFPCTDASYLSSHASILAEADLIVDAIFGTGLRDEVKGISLHAIEMINAMKGRKSRVVSADIPSGLSSDTGMPLGGSVVADDTVTFALPKLGLCLGRGLEYCGNIHVVDIGIPPEEAEKIPSKYSLIVGDDVRRSFLPRRMNSHKGTFGHVAIFAGSRAKIGAGYLSSRAALRSGSGLVTYAMPESAFAFFDSNYSEVMCEPLPDNGKAFFCHESLDKALHLAQDKSAVAIGPAIGTEEATRAFLNAFVRDLKTSLVIDADGLNLLDLSSLRMRGAATVLTPHPGEMARLTKSDTGLVNANRTQAAISLAASCGAIVVLKGMGTVVAAPDGRCAINRTGNSGMASAGMGDALTGIILSLLGQGLDPFDAACAGVFVHGMAGDFAASEIGERALITSDLIKNLPRVFSSIETHSHSRGIELDP